MLDFHGGEGVAELLQEGEESETVLAAVLSPTLFIPSRSPAYIMVLPTFRMGVVLSICPSVPAPSLA